MSTDSRARYFIEASSRLSPCGLTVWLLSVLLASAVAAADSGVPLQTRRIDELISKQWSANDVRPSRAATDGEWCRRLFLDVIGRIPTVDELERFLKNRSPAKKSELVDDLLGDDYIESYARNWTTLWTNILIGRTGGTEPGSLTSRAGMQQYLRRTFQRNKPYKTMVAELIGATGSTRPGSENFNGATNFLAMKMGENGVQATAQTAQVFLGQRVQCTQCHDHPFNDRKQNQFWEFNAFFRQARVLRAFRGDEISGVRIADQDFAGEGGDPAEAEIYFEQRNGLVKIAYPVFLDGTSLVEVKGEGIGNRGYLDDVNRRQELVEMVLGAPDLERAMVNRTWSHFLGYGFSNPIDDMGPHNPPTHPELLEFLSAEFRASDFDIKRLIRWITLSRPYGLSSRETSRNRQDDPSLGEKPVFSRFYLRQMRAEELFQSLIVATEAQNTRGTYEEQEKAKREWLLQFTRAFGTDDNGEVTTFDGTIPQALMMMNGGLVRRAASGEPGNFLHRVATDKDLKPSARIRKLYLAALSRGPTSKEIKVGLQLIAKRNGNLVEALQDVWWALLNSNEFILNH